MLFQSPKRNNVESYGGKNIRARLELFHSNWPEPVGFFWPARTTNGKRTKCCIAGLEITAGQRTMSGLNWELTGQPFVLPVMLTGHI